MESDALKIKKQDPKLIPAGHNLSLNSKLTVNINTDSLFPST